MTIARLSSIAFLSASVALAADAPSTQPAAPTSEPVATTEPSTQPSTRPSSSAADRAAELKAADDAEKTLDRLLRAKPGTARPLEPVPPEEGSAEYKAPRTVAAPALPPSMLKREGDIVTQRLGRLYITADGRREFHFDSDRKTLSDPPMVILPNENLARMEEALKKSGRDIRFRVTGVITTYRGENYLLVEKVDQQPEQEGL